MPTPSDPLKRSTRVDFGEPMLSSDGRWVCVAKIKSQLPWLGGDSQRPPATEVTQTLLVRAGFGETPEEARREVEKKVAFALEKDATSADIREVRRGRRSVWRKCLAWLGWE